MKPISLVVIDDHPLFRKGVADVLALEPDLQIVGQASDGESGLALIRKLLPQVAIVDVNLPGLNGHQITRQVVAEHLPTRIILLTAYDDEEQKIHSIRGGAAAYCTKDIQPEGLIRVVRSVISGEFVIDDERVDPARLERWLESRTESAMRLYSEPGEPYEPLSGREMEVLTLLTRGLSNKEIALSLGISHQTVKNHVTAILRKLNVEDRTQAAVCALRRGWVRLYSESTGLEE
jgi:DNA-binding NarL/FixJ family response regulator